MEIRITNYEDARMFAKNSPSLCTEEKTEGVLSGVNSLARSCSIVATCLP